MDPATHARALGLAPLASQVPRTTWRTASGRAPFASPSLWSLVLGRLRRLRGRLRRTSAWRMASGIDPN